MNTEIEIKDGKITHITVDNYGNDFDIQVYDELIRANVPVIEAYFAAKGSRSRQLIRVDETKKANDIR